VGLRTFGGWPLIVLLHGWTPEETREHASAPIGNAGDSERTLCRGDLDPAGLQLYERWDSAQRYLARAGYVSVAPNLSPVRLEARDVIEAFLEQSDKAANVDAGRVGLIGHSRGAHDVDDYPGGRGRVARVVIGPAAGTGGVTQLEGPNLTITSPHDFNHGGEDVYAQAQAPRHLVLFTALWTGYSHYSYFDGLCHDGTGEGSTEAAPLQRSVTRRAIGAFFDHYLRDEPLRDDLGMDEENVTIEHSAENR